MDPAPLLNFNLRDAYRILFRHRRRCLVCFVSVVALVVGVLLTIQRKYDSEAQLLVNVGAESLNGDHTATKSGNVSLQIARDEEIKSVLDLFRSRVIAEDVVRSLGADVVLERDPQDDSPSLIGGMIGSAKSAVRGLLGSVVVNDEEKAIEKLMKNISVVAEPKSKVIRITAQANTPKAAQQFAAAYVEAGRNKHSQAHQTKNSTSFLKRKTDQTRERLLAASRKLGELKTRVGVVSLDGQKASIEDQVNGLEKQRMAEYSRLREFHDKIKTLQAQLTRQDRVDAENGTSMSPQALDEMRNKLFALRIESHRAVSMYTDVHPFVVAAREQVRATEAKLQVEELRFAEAGVRSINSKIAAIDDDLGRQRAKLKTVNENEVEIKKLESEVELLQKSYVSYHTNLEASKIIEDRRKQRITNINVFQPAGLVETPGSPNRKMLLSLGVAVALFSSLGVALLSEVLDSSFQTPDEVENQLEVAVLQTIPQARGRAVI